MSNVREFFNKENSHKVFLCNVKGFDDPIQLQCYYDVVDGVSAYAYNDNYDCDFITDITNVINEVEIKQDDNHCDYNEEQTEEETQFLDSKLVDDDDVYTYNTNEELQKLIKCLRVDIMHGNQESQYGLLYYYSEYDDFDCYGDGWTYYIKIIDKARIC